MLKSFAEKISLKYVFFHFKYIISLFIRSIFWCAIFGISQRKNKRQKGSLISSVFLLLFLMIYHITLLRNFITILPDSLPLESEWQVSIPRTLRFLADLKNAILFMVSTHPLISNSPLLLPIFDDCTERTNYNWYHRQFSFSMFLCNLSFCFLSVVSRNAKYTIQHVLFVVVVLFCYFRLLLGLVVWSRFGDPFVSQNP